LKPDHQSDKLIAEMNRYYEANATRHDECMSYTTREKMEELFKPVLSALDKMINGKSILEIACGTGNWTQILARRAASVVAVDVSPTALELARSKLSDLSNVTLVEADIYRSSPVAGPVDVVFAADWWSHIPLRMCRAFLDSVAGPLGPGGRAIFIDMSENDYFRNEPHYFDADGNRVSRRKLPDGSEFEVVRNFPSSDELARLTASITKEFRFVDLPDLGRWMMIMQLG
jgi:demethylmenaquinone methyltransferase/2-methoxy-6-polyprenyl-1,4-benzoquinol methylase